MTTQTHTHLSDSVLFIELLIFDLNDPYALTVLSALSKFQNDYSFISVPYRMIHCSSKDYNQIYFSGLNGETLLVEY